MAAPTITWYKCEGAESGGEPASENAISVVDYGSVQAGYWSDMICIRAGVTGNMIHTMKYWLHDKDGSSTTGAYDVSTSGWQHSYSVHQNYTDPSTCTDDNKPAGQTFPPTATRAVLDVTTEPTTANITAGGAGKNTSNDKVGVGTPPDGSTLQPKTDFIYLAVFPNASAPDGVIQGWSYRKSFLYP